jgi:hypothetical protein
MPYGREGERLHLPPVPEALNRAGRVIRAKDVPVRGFIFGVETDLLWERSQLPSRLLPERIWACKI